MSTPTTVPKKGYRKITRGFQITLPPFFREKNNLHVGDLIEVEEKSDGIFIKSLRFTDDKKEEAVQNLLKILNESVENSAFSDMKEEEIMKMVDAEIQEVRKAKK